MAEIKRKYYSSGQLKFEWFEVNGIKEGEIKSYHMNGDLFEICNFVNGKLEGEYKRYYENGQLCYIINWVNGREEGEHKLYNMSGQINSTCNYVNGEVCEFKRYNDNEYECLDFTILEKPAFNWDSELILNYIDNKVCRTNKRTSYISCCLS